MKPIMFNKINISPEKQKLIVYLALIVVTFAVFWQVNQYDFVNFDDQCYVIQNIHIQSGITPDGIRWAFSTKYTELWHPLIWLSFMFDYQLFGLIAGGYHLTNLILHILSTLLLFWLFNRMTGAIWKSAFVAAVFALHPLHVESVAWIAERKDVLSAFFWMLTLCLYVYYTERPAVKRYILVLFSFVLALMSKPMVVTLPVIMVLLDYWPLGRFESQKSGNCMTGAVSPKAAFKLLREKIPFFILSAVLVIITLYNPDNTDHKLFPLDARIANALVSLVTYLEKTFWPHDMAIFYPFSLKLPLWQVLGSGFLIIFASTAVILMAKRYPYLLVGWLWYMITLLPVIGIIQIWLYSAADRYHYLPSIGIAVMLAWGLPALIKNKNTRKKILFPTAIAFLAILSILSWQQCGYWKNSIELWNHTLQVTKNNDIAHTNRGAVYAELGQYQRAVEDYNEVIKLRPGNFLAYYNRGNMYAALKQYQRAIEDYNEVIRMKPDHADSYNNRGWTYFKQGFYQLAFKDLDEVIRLKRDNADAYNNRGGAYFKRGQYQTAIEDFDKAIRLKQDYADAYNNRGGAYFKRGQYQPAIDDYNKAIRLKQDYADAYNNLGIVYLNQGNKNLGCYNAQKACALGNCKTLETSGCKGYNR